MAELIFSKNIDITFMNSENSKTSKSYALIINLTDKLHFKRGAKSIVLSNFSIYYA